MAKPISINIKNHRIKGINKLKKYIRAGKDYQELMNVVNKLEKQEKEIK